MEERGMVGCGCVLMRAGGWCVALPGCRALLGLYLLCIAHAAHAGVLYVSPSGSATPPYDSWSKAANTIQDAVDAASPGDQVMVTNGVYDTGGSAAPGFSLTNRVYVGQAIILRSVNGPEATIIEGRKHSGPTDPVRGVHLVAGAVLDGFTVRQGGAWHSGGDNVHERSGGGVLFNGGGLVTHCIITDCDAQWGAGAYIYQDGTVRNTLLTNNVSLGTAGGGIMLDGGGMVEACLISGNSMGIPALGGSGGGVYLRDGGLVTGSTIYSNQAMGTGGGVAISGSGGLVEHSRIDANRASIGAGVYMTNGIVRSCVIEKNEASQNGGGFFAGHYGEIRDCRIVRNTADAYGGGFLVDGGSVLNSLIAENEATSVGGLSISGPGMAKSCTIIGNRAQTTGGVRLNNDATLINAIVFHNEAPFDANWLIEGAGATVSHTCTEPDPGGSRNIIADPLLAGIGNPNLLPGSPCIDAGDSAHSPGATDLNGNPRIAGRALDVGCVEFNTTTQTGALSVAISANYTSAVAHYALSLRAVTDGQASRLVWDFKDGNLVTNATVVEHAWAAPGDYVVELTAYNNDHPAGVSGALAVSIIAGYTNYVAKTGSHTAPFTSWASAANTIQAAIDANPWPGGVVMVGPGTYADAGYVTNGVGHIAALTRPVRVRSSEGREVTILRGGGADGSEAVRCALLAEGSVLEGFTLTGGRTAPVNTRTGGGGGGAFLLHGGTITNCLVVSNRAHYAGGGVLAYGGGYVLDSLITHNAGTNINSLGGGVFTHKGGLFAGCLIASNSVGDYGGGVYADEGGIFHDCEILGNQAHGHYGRGGGVYILKQGYVHDCLIAGNTALGSDFYPNYGGGVYMQGGGTLDSCRILDNSAQRAGGVYMNGGELDDCTVTGNSAIGGWDSGIPRGVGGGIYIESSGLVQHSLVSSNWAGIHGGGIVGYQGGVVSNSTITFNVASNGVAGGIMMEQGGMIIDCLVMNNQAPGTGGGDAGGVYIGSGTLVDRCLIAANEASRWAGGIYLRNGGTLRNSLLVHNGAWDSAGGALLFEGGLIENCTISDNIVPGGSGWGGGVYFYQGGEAVNTIIYHNSAMNGPNYFLHDVASVISHSCTTPDPGGIGNSTNDPLFVDRPGFDYHLQPSSTAIKAGMNQPWMSAAYDLEGRPRILGGTVDMGAFEHGGHRIVATSGPHGQIMPEGEAWVASGSNATFSISADAYYHIHNVLVDDQPADGFTPGTSLFDYTFQEVASDHELTASFGENLASLGTPHWWLALHNLTNGLSFDLAELADPDGDGAANWKEFVANTDPNDARSVLMILEIASGPPRTLYFAPTSPDRLYRLESTDDLREEWTTVPGGESRPGTGGPDGMAIHHEYPVQYYRIRVSRP